MLALPYRKKIRGAWLAQMIRRVGYRGAVCFSSGNAARALEAEGIHTVHVGPSGPLHTDDWWTPEQIARTWPDLFDATSGHLPVWYMRELGQEYLWNLPYLTPGGLYVVPSGSGETMVSLALAAPQVRFRAEYGVTGALAFSPLAPLNPLVDRLSA